MYCLYEFQEVILHSGAAETLFSVFSCHVNIIAFYILVSFFQNDILDPLF